MTIQELYYDDRFSNVVYFLSECGFSFLEDLKAFDFDELLFVPGVSEDIIEEAKRLYFDSQNVQEQEPGCEAVNEENTSVLARETIESISLSVDFSQEVELQNLFLQCTDSLRSVIQGIAVQIKSWVLEPLLQTWKPQKVLINLF